MPTARVSSGTFFVTTAPAPVPVSPVNPFNLYYDGAAGEVLYSITNRELAAVP